MDNLKKKYFRTGRRSFCATYKTGNYEKGIVNQTDPLDPYRELLMAIIERAVRDATDGTQPKPIRRQAYQWLLSNRREPFCFMWIADVLELETIFLSRLRRFINLEYH